MTNKTNVDKSLPSNGLPLAVELISVSKQLRGRQVLKDINLTVAQGDIVGVYGPNGSGKSMMLRVISGLVRPDTGAVRVFNQEIGSKAEFPQELGALIDGPGFALEMSGRRNLELLASIRGLISHADIRETIQLVGLDPEDHRPVRTYSTGMRQRLGVAQAIMENPRLLLLDEPTSALDPDGAAQIYNILQKLNSQGTSIILVSHDQTEIRKLCRHIYRMYDGILHHDH